MKFKKSVFKIIIYNIQIFSKSKIIFQNFDRSSASAKKKREKEAIFLPALLSKGKVQ